MTTISINQPAACDIQVGKTYKISRKAFPLTDRKVMPARKYRVLVREIRAIEDGKTIHYGDRLGEDDRPSAAFVLPDSNIKSITEVT